MPRAVKEWCGKTDDSPAPPRVRLRIFQREKGICNFSGRKIQPGEPYQLDHRIAIINGGKNCESNLYPVLVDKHKEKTKLDLAEKSRIAKRAKSHVGIRADGPKIKSRGFKKKVRRHEGRDQVNGETAFARQIVSVEEGEANV
jgi:5-methylcytosine-specific restriction enzyme A